MILGVLLALIVLLLGSVGVWAYYEFLYTEPLSEAELVELSTDWDVITEGNWSPWYDLGDGITEWNPTASYNAWLATIPDDDKAWPILVDAKYAFSDVLDDDRMKSLSGMLPEDPQRWAILRPVLESDRAQLLSDRYQEAFAKSVMGCELMSSTDPHLHDALLRHGIEDFNWDQSPPDNPSIFETLLPWLGDCRKASNFLCSQGALSLENNDPDAFVAMMESVAQSADHCDAYPALIGHQVRIAIEMKLISTLSWAMENHPDRFDEAHLKRLRAACAVRMDPAHVWRGERLNFEDSIRRLSTKGGSLAPGASIQTGNGNINLGRPVSMPVQELHASAQRPLLVHGQLLDEATRQSQLPWKIGPTSDEFLQQERDELGIAGYMILDLIAPATGNASSSLRMIEQERIGIEVAIAAHLHKIRHGEFPATLDDFDDDLLTLNPIDAFTGNELGYSLTESGPLVYSVGDNRIDNGGKVIWIKKLVGPIDEEVEIRRPRLPEWLRAEQLQQRQRNDTETIDGDWVLYPVPFADPEPLDENEQGFSSDP